jgi:hypothetical protein
MLQVHAGMKHIRWIPLAFLAGVDGFAIFAPYAALMMALAFVLERRQRRAALVPVPVRA